MSLAGVCCLRHNCCCHHNCCCCCRGTMDEVEEVVAKARMWRWKPYGEVTLRFAQDANVSDGACWAPRHTAGWIGCLAQRLLDVPSPAVPSTPNSRSHIPPPPPGDWHPQPQPQLLPLANLSDAIEACAPSCFTIILYRRYQPCLVGYLQCYDAMQGAPVELMQDPLHYPHGTKWMAPGPMGQVSSSSSSSSQMGTPPCPPWCGRVQQHWSSHC
jgi:hypothetical protein